jgi:predicted glutamine amidotransferase
MVNARRSKTILVSLYIRQNDFYVLQLENDIMCVIAFFNKSRPDFDTLRKMDRENSDGMGIMYFKGNLAHYKKGITDVKELFDISKEIKLPFVLHFRKESCGGKQLLLTHPFEVNKSSKLRFSGKCKRLLMHNGTHRDYEDFLAAAGIYNDNNEPLSDTRAIAMIISKDNERFLTRYNSYQQRFILADANLKKFIMFGDFTQENGNYYSNTIWKYEKVRVTHGHDYSHTDYYGNVHRDYSKERYQSSSNLVNAEKPNSTSDYSKLPAHYQEQKQFEFKESLAELILGSKRRKKYKRWLELHQGVRNPFIEPDSGFEELDAEKLIAELEEEMNEGTIERKSEFLPSEFQSPKTSRINAMTEDEWRKAQEEESELCPKFVKTCCERARQVLGIGPKKLAMAKVSIKDSTDYLLYPSLVTRERIAQEMGHKEENPYDIDT